MKDKQIKYLLTLKRKFESIRRDQYVFSERNPLPAIRSSSSSPTTVSSNSVAMQKLYQMINYTLQSIEFKILDTVTESQKKHNTNSREQQSNSHKHSSRSIPSAHDQEQRSQNEDQVDSSLSPSGQTKTAQPRRQNKQNLLLSNIENIFKPKQSSSQSYQIQYQPPSQIISERIIEEEDTQPQKNSIRLIDINGTQERQLLPEVEYSVLESALSKNLNSTQNLFDSHQLFFFENETPFRPEHHQMKIDIELPKSDQGSSVNGLLHPVLHEDENDNDNLSIDGYLNFETPKKNIFIDDQSEPIEIFMNKTADENMNQNEINQQGMIAYFSSEDIPNLQPSFLMNCKQELTGIIIEEEEDLQNLNAVQQERNNILKSIENSITTINRSQGIMDSDNKQYLQTMKKVLGGGGGGGGGGPSSIQKNESGATVKQYPFTGSDTERNKLNQTIQKEKRLKVFNEEGLEKLNDEKGDPIDDNDDCEDDDDDDDDEEDGHNDYDQIEEIYYCDKENRECFRGENSNSDKKRVAKKLDFKQREEDIKSYVRGPYNFYSEELKMKAIRDYFKFQDIKRAAEINEVKVKNLKRWITVGHKRKEGGGRKKEDPEMEELVFEWLQERYIKLRMPATRNEIREKALQFSNKKDKFKASKGWLEKFFSRYDCKHMSKKDFIQPSFD